jgi:hypothetical protein
MSADVTNFDEVREFTLELQSVIALGAQLTGPSKSRGIGRPSRASSFNDAE